jgi:hypothetical protein
VSILHGLPMRGRPDRYLGEAESIFWEVMGFLGPKPPEIGLRGTLRRLVGEGRIAEAYITALHWDLHFDPGPEEAEPTPVRRSPARTEPARAEVPDPGPRGAEWRTEG